MLENEKLNKADFVCSVRQRVHSEPTKSMWTAMYVAYNAYPRRNVLETIKLFYMHKTQIKEFEERKELLARIDREIIQAHKEEMRKQAAEQSAKAAAENEGE